MDSIKSFKPKTQLELNELLKKLLTTDLDYNIIIDLTGLKDINFLKEIHKLSNLSKKNKKSCLHHDGHYSPTPLLPQQQRRHHQ